MSHLVPLIAQAQLRLTTAGDRLADLTQTATGCTDRLNEQAEADLVLRALLKQRTDESFKEVEELILRGLKTVFSTENWTAVKIDCQQVRGRLSGELVLVQGDVEAPPLEAFGGGPTSLAAFLLRMLVVRRVGLAPLLLLDESFSQVSARDLPALAKFLRLLVDKLGFTILLVTHQPLFAEYANHVYTASHNGQQTTLTKEAA
jgi:hypothetical protein